MSGKNEDLHGNAPDKAEIALLLIDVINDLEFPEGDQLLRHALPMARQVAALKERARRVRSPINRVRSHEAPSATTGQQFGLLVLARLWPFRPGSKRRG